MKIYISKFFILLIVLGFLSACEKEENLSASLTDLGGETWPAGPIDNWLKANYVTPYNIEVKYRFDRYEVSLGKALTPVREDRVIPVMETIMQTWIKPYEDEAGQTFIKRLSPKQFVLVGSPEFNSNGTITLGTAEGGRKVVLYVINNFDKKNKKEVKQMLHTIHHEFGHILHQNIMYPEEYKRITPDYTASWNDFSLADARSRGYITEYARSNPDDDFVEMISLLLIEGKNGFDNIINSIPSATAKADLRKKEQIIVRYYKEAWNINIYSLQARAEEAINKL